VTQPTRLVDLLRSAKAIAKEYYRLTGRPLGITGEVAEYEAARLLGVELAEVRQAGYDAVRRRPDGGVDLIQIKGRCFARGFESGQRLGTIQLERKWDVVMMVLLDPDFEAREIYEARRPEISAALSAPGSVARNERSSLPVAKFRSIGTLLWRRDR
jgi:hypothetical protein